MKTFSFSVLLTYLLASCTTGGSVSAQDSGLVGPPPPVPHVGPVSRPLMTVVEDYQGACGPVGFDLSFVQIERGPGLDSYNTTITRWKIGTRGREIAEPIYLPKNGFIRNIDFGCKGDDRLLITLSIVEAYDEAVQRRVIQYDPTGITYDFTRNVASSE